MASLRFHWLVCLLLISTVSCDVLSYNILKNLNSFLSVDSTHYRLNKSDQVMASDYDNERCNSQIKMLLEGVFGFEMWALEVVDSWGKLPAGLLRFNYREWGHFDECLDVFKESGPNNVQMNGQYCIATLGITGIHIQTPLNQQEIVNDIINTNPNFRMPVAPGMFGIQLGICIPNACSPEYFLQMLTNVTAEPILGDLPNDMTIKFTGIERCQQKQDVQFDGLDIFAITFFTFIGCLLISSTIYDVVMTHKERSKNANLIAFSVYTNGEKLFKCNHSKSENVLDCLNGIRVLSIVWIVFGHTYGSVAGRPSINGNDMLTWLESYVSQVMLNGTVAVDTFFILSGLLVCWSLLRHLDQNKGSVNIFLLYFHRYLRLTPAFAVAILFYVTMFRYIGSGPVWNTNEREKCAKWWLALLYVQNYQNIEESCLGHSWYLSIDMQLFIASPAFIYPLWRWKRKFVPVIVIMILLSMGCTFAIYMVNDFKYGFTISENNLERMQKTYFPTQTRMGVWFAGLLLGYILHTFKGRALKLSKTLVLIGWLTSLGTIFSVLFAAYNLNQIPNNTTVLENAFYEVFSRITWGISVSWIIFACVHGYGGPINWFLSWPQWQPLGRLSYSIYLLHVPMISWLDETTKTSSYFSDVNTIHLFWGNFGFTLTLSVIWVIAFESPILTLEKVLLGRGGSEKTKAVAKVKESHVANRVSQS